MTRARGKAVKLNVAAGDLVLLGHPEVTMPSDWYVARVLWADAAEILVEHTNATGGAGRPDRYLHDIAYVRAAAGDIATLLDFRRVCKAEVAEAKAEVRAIEQQLGEARRKVWQKIEEIAARSARIDPAKAPRR